MSLDYGFIIPENFVLLLLKVCFKVFYLFVLKIGHTNFSLTFDFSSILWNLGWRTVAYCVSRFSAKNSEDVGWVSRTEFIWIADNFSILNWFSPATADSANFMVNFQFVAWNFPRIKFHLFGLGTITLKLWFVVPFWVGDLVVLLEWCFIILNCWKHFQNPFKTVWSWFY